MHSGYILQKNLPTQNSVVAFTDLLFQFIFPVVENEENFLLEREDKANQLKRHFTTLIDTCLIDNNGDKDLVVNTFFNQLSDTTEILVKDAQFILDYDPAAKTFHLDFTWGAGPGSRRATVILKYLRPR